MKLRALVKEEQLVRDQRKECFLGKQFVMSDPGSLFPRSWMPSFDVVRAAVHMPESLPQGILQSRPEYKKGHVATLLAHILNVSAPVFDKCTEDGMRFRAYRIGSLDVRTTQEIGDKEEIGAVFSICARSGKTILNRKPLKEDEELSKVTEYVEASLDPNSLQLRCQYYIVLETVRGEKIVTERLRDGKVTWEQDPEDLDDRSSLAKVSRCADCSPGLTVGDMLLYYNSTNEQIKAGNVDSASSMECRRYAWATFEGVRVQEPQLPPLHEIAREIRMSLHEVSEAHYKDELEEPKRATRFAEDSDALNSVIH